jgi:hypothetical protein
MSSDLADAIERAEIDDIAHALFLRDRLDAKIFEAIARFDRDSAWAADGATSMTAWLRANAGLAGGVAAGIVKRANKLARRPVLARAWLHGDLSFGQVQAVLTNVSDATLDRFADDEGDLVPLLRPLSVEDTTS